MPLPTDPLLAQQWHLQNSNPALLDLNVFGVWNPIEGPAYTGAGTRVFVIDSGFDYTHSDLAPNYNLALDFDFETNIVDAFGGPSDSHGTAVMGIIGADDNGTGSVGIAFDANLVGYRTTGLISDAWLQDVRDAIFFAGSDSRNGDVMNISLGIANDASSEFGVGYNPLRFDEIENSIRDAVGLGRGGLGTTIVKSAGNSRTDNYDVNADDWTNDTRQVVVAAVDQNGFISSYSSYGAANLVSGFGTPGEVLTTDRVGAAGYNPTDFTSAFNGTSSAAPMVAGVVALMYEAEDGLGWRDVQSILGVSARHVGSAVGAGTTGAERYAWGFNAASTWNGGGQHYSNDYGYGLVDALAAVRLAETWLITGAAATITANETSNTMDVLDIVTFIPDGNATGTTFNGIATSDDIVERVTVQMTFSTTFTGDLEIFLTSPDGTVSQLIDNAGGGNDFNGTWTFETQAFRGERAAGTWSVRVVDTLSGDDLTVSDIVIRTFGASTVDDRYVFTNEFSNYAGLFGHVTAVADSNGGTDTANASAVSAASNIRLDGTIGSIDGVAVTFANIENAIGGDGHDTIAGNGGNNQLFGMRGNDALLGQGGNDTLEGGTGNDTLNGDAGNDTLRGGADNDLLRGGTQEDRLFGEGGNDRLFGQAGFDYLDGGAGNDTLDGGAQADNLLGGTGNDLMFGGGGFDRLFGGTGNDTGYGGDGSDALFGQQDNDRVFGQDGNDRLFGGTGNDYLDGGSGNDSLFGGAGFDTLLGSIGNDTMTGNFNADTFIFADFGGGFGADVITDFAATNNFERIDLSRVSAIVNLFDLFSNHMSQVGADVLIDAGGGNTITLLGVSMGDLDATDFVF